MTMENMINKLLKSEGFRQSFLIISSSLLASGFSAISIILISRLLGPEKFSHFSIAISLGYILNRVNDFGLTMVIQKRVGGEKDKNVISVFLSICLKYRILLSIIITTLGIIFSKSMANFLNIENHNLIIITFLSSLAVSYFEHYQAMLQSLRLFNKVAFNYLLQSFIKLLLAIVVFFSFYQNVYWILALFLLATLPSVILGEIDKPAWIKYGFLKNSAKEKNSVFKVLKHAAFAVIAAGIIENVDILFSKHFLSELETGVLGGVSRIALILAVVAYGLASVLNPRVAAYKDKMDMDKFLKKAWIILGLSILGYFAVLPFSTLLIKFTIGNEYLSGLKTLDILLAAGFVSIGVMPFIACFYGLKNNSYFSISALLQLVIILAGNIYFIPLYGIEASAWTRLVSRIAMLIFTLIFLQINYRKEFGK